MRPLRRRSIKPSRAGKGQQIGRSGKFICFFNICGGTVRRRSRGGVRFRVGVRAGVRGGIRGGGGGRRSAREHSEEATAFDATGRWEILAVMEGVFRQGYRGYYLLFNREIVGRLYRRCIMPKCRKIVRCFLGNTGLLQ